jgi:chromosome segregation ATPase
MKLDVVKLALDENIASPELTELLVEQIADQASQGWGVKEIDSVVLCLAKEVVRLQPFEDHVDEAQRQMKGQQLAAGRLRKQLENLEPQLESLKADNAALRVELESLTKQLAAAKVSGDEET